MGKIQEGAKGRVEIKKGVKRRGAEGGKEQKGEKVGKRECGCGVGKQVGGKKLRKGRKWEKDTVGEQKVGGER